MIIKLPLDICTGCSACFAVCPTKCIEMRENDEGFMQPVVELSKCIECGSCVAVCPMLKNYAERKPLKSFFGWVSNRDLRLKSSSGGAYSAIAEGIKDSGGCAFGAVYDFDNTSVYHASTDSRDFSEQRKSKYVESDLRNSFIEVQENLVLGRDVVFSGTPCQVAGLKEFLGKDYENLLLVDFICHGVPSRLVFRDYLLMLEHKYRSIVNRIDFRPKLIGWRKHSISVSFENGKKYNRDAASDPYLGGFMSQNLFLKKSCYKCKFRGAHLSDITIADFWAWEKHKHHLKDNYGASLVMLNSEKALGLHEKLKKSMKLIEINFDDIAYAFRPRTPEEYGFSKRHEFFKTYKVDGCEKTLKKMVRIATWRRRIVFWWQMHWFSLWNR